MKPKKHKTKFLPTLFLLLIIATTTKTCSDENCKTCPDPKKICTECKQYFFLNSTTSECDDCPSHCLKCKSKKICDQCNNGYNLVDFVGKTVKESTKTCRINWLSLKFLGIVIGGFFGLFLIGFIFCWFMRRSKKTEDDEDPMVQSLMQDEDKFNFGFNEEENKKKYVRQKYSNGVNAIEEEGEETVISNKSEGKNGSRFQSDRDSLSKSSHLMNHNSFGSKFSNNSVFKSSIRGDDFFEENNHHFQNIGVSVSQVPDYFNPEAQFRYEKKKESDGSRRGVGEDSMGTVSSKNDTVSRNVTVYESVNDESKFFENFESVRDERGDTQNTFMTTSEMDGDIWDGIDD